MSRGILWCQRKICDVRGKYVRAIPFEILKRGRNVKICRPPPHILIFSPMLPHTYFLQPPPLNFFPVPHIFLFFREPLSIPPPSLRFSNGIALMPIVSGGNLLCQGEMCQGEIYCVRGKSIVSGGNLLCQGEIHCVRGKSIVSGEYLLCQGEIYCVRGKSIVSGGNLLCQGEIHCVRGKSLMLERNLCCKRETYWSITSFCHTISVHWLYTAVSSVLPVYTLSNPVYSYTEATLDPLQCMHSVHYSVCPVYTLTDTGTGPGWLPLKLALFTFTDCWLLDDVISNRV